MLVIESDKNPLFRELASLLTGKAIVELQKALVFGEKTTRFAYEQAPDLIESVVLSQGMEKPSVFNEVPGIVFKKSLFERLDVFGTHAPLLVTRLPSFMKISGSSPERYVVVPFQDPGNVGAVIRTATQLGVRNIILSPGAAHPFHPRSARASSGLIYKANFYKIKSHEEIEALGLPVLSLEMDGKDLHTFKFPPHFVLMAGVEGLGLSPEQRAITTEFLSIPMVEGSDSLNAMVATSIALFCASKS